MLQPLVQPIFFWPLASLVEVPDLFFQLWVTLETLGNLLWPICCDPVDPAVFRFMFHPRWRDELPVRWVSHGFSKWTCFKLFFNKPRQSVFTERWLSYWKQGISCWHMFLCFLIPEDRSSRAIHLEFLSPSVFHESNTMCSFSVDGTQALTKPHIILLGFHWYSVFLLLPIMILDKYG